MYGHNWGNSQRKTSDSQFSSLVKGWQRGTRDDHYWKNKSGLQLPGEPSKGIKKASRKNKYCKAFIANKVKEVDALHVLKGWTFTLRTQLHFIAWQRMVQEFSRQNSPASEPEMTSQNKVAFITSNSSDGFAFLAISPNGQRLFADDSGCRIVLNILGKTDMEFKYLNTLLSP